MFSSTIIPTVGRESLATSVNSVLSQQLDLDEYELIVVNDSGLPLSAAPWQSAPNVRILETKGRERCFARNAGAAIARGRYLHFLDDDDWLLPGALQEVWNLAHRAPHAAWLYGGIRIVDTKDETLLDINSRLSGNRAAHFVGGAWAPIQVSWLATETFFAVGGFDTRMPPVVEDLDLCRKISMVGEFGNSPRVLGCLRRDVEWDSQTSYEFGPEINRRLRDALLEQTGAWKRLVLSTSDPYWTGRVAHAYLSGVQLNLRDRRFFRATSRLLHLLLTTFITPSNILRRKFWAGVRASQVPDTLYDALLLLDRKLEQTTQ